MDLLSGKIALVTGGLGGLGSAVAHRFAGDGATVLASCAASGAAARGLRRAAARDVAEPGSGASAPRPGSTAPPTPYPRRFAGPDCTPSLPPTPLGGRGDPADVAELALYLA